MYRATYGVTPIAWTFTGLLLLVLVVCITAGRGSIPLNHYVGVRIPALMRSPAAWRAGHAAGVLPSAVAFVIALASSVLGLVAPIAYWGAIVAFVGGLVWLCARASHIANRADPS